MRLRLVSPPQPRDIVWTASLTNGRPIVHAFHLRTVAMSLDMRPVPTTAAAWAGNGTKGHPTRCGLTWTLTATPIEGRPEFHDYRYPGTRLYVFQAEALGAHFCRHCFRATQQTLGAAA